MSLPDETQIKWNTLHKDHVVYRLLESNVWCVQFMRTSAAGIIAGEPLMHWVTKGSTCLSITHVLYEQQFPPLLYASTHVLAPLPSKINPVHAFQFYF
jgi:hypothetical protein